MRKISPSGKRQATTIGQIFVNDPAVSSFATAGSTNWWGLQIRGLGVRNYYIDDVPLILYWGGDYPLESVENVRALKGLSGFMYGFGAPGGVISYTTKRPTAEPMLTTEIGWRGKSDLYAHVDAGGPLTQDGRLGYRINIAGEKGTAYNDAGVNRWLASLALDYQLSDTLKWYATGTYEDSNLKHEPLMLYWSSYEDKRLPKVRYDYDKINVKGSYYKARTLAAATGFDWEFADKWSVKATYGYTSKRHHSNKMFGYLLNAEGDYEGNVYTFAELDQNHFVQAMVQGEFTTGPIRHALVAGASYMVNNSYFGANSYWSNDFNGNLYEEQTFTAPRTSDIDFSTAGTPFEERQKALFLSDTLYLGDHVQAVLGVRHTRYKLLDKDGDPTADSGYRTSATSPTLALIFKPVPYVSLYGSYVESLEPGSRVSGEYANSGEILKATVSKQYEIGAKYDHGAVSLTAAAFRIERTNVMEQMIDGERYLKQNGMTLYRGIEASGSFRVSPNFRFGLGAIYLDGQIRDADPYGDIDTSGNRPAELAKWQLLANAEYYVAAIPGLSIHGNVRRTGKAPTDDTNRLYLPGFTLANLGMQYATEIGGQKVVFTGNVNNIFNKKYWGQGGLGEGINASFSAKVAW